MATHATRASRATHFVQQCRKPQPLTLLSIRQSSSSPYAPSNFSNSPSNSASSDSPSSQKGNATSSSSPALAIPRPSYAHPPARRFGATEMPGTKLTAWTWLKSLFGWRPTSTYSPAPFRVNNNPYRARKSWPPDFNNLDPKQQFHFEKTYRRRAALKWARPTWNKSIKILQQTLITFTIIYFVFICEPTHGQGTPFDGFRAWFFDKVGMLGQLPESTREEAEKLSEEARKRLVASVDTSNSPTNS
ncbi:hypothetical protein LTR96_009857 [Exophiala xenobiotica]|uniref:Transmembrane protein n=1 Tax=Vermiconidia calcicola TaxID=1690605 RepID=A0AAV9PYF2_9PEZI|nr:hypothetical protein LTR72_008775 [Exophiala xenobiotica]KAK5531515.1 hypothetical protein LTR25_008624 [Vermiconidia calcicola]KAK5544698.1 hypothetical protein LTR23_004138 [Chaetothyriales sp. CCFEE 6169]KAK5264690.1 hypothetical protein LTR96_009857 [Exophiala xenobiotica]KAK5336962.1 hypothetical protein LTR98_007269 [Exophiala xenobiotica]